MLSEARRHLREPKQIQDREEQVDKGTTDHGSHWKAYRIAIPVLFDLSQYPPPLQGRDCDVFEVWFSQTKQVFEVVSSKGGKGNRECRRDMLCNPTCKIKFTCRLQDLLGTGSLRVQGQLQRISRRNHCEASYREMIETSGSGSGLRSGSESRRLRFGISRGHTATMIGLLY